MKCHWRRCEERQLLPLIGPSRNFHVVADSRIDRDTLLGDRLLCVVGTCNDRTYLIPLRNISKWTITIHSSPFAPSTNEGPIRPSSPSPLPQADNCLILLSSKDTSQSPLILSHRLSCPRYFGQHMQFSSGTFSSQFHSFKYSSVLGHFSVRTSPWPPSIRGSNDQRPISWTPFFPQLGTRSPGNGSNGMLSTTQSI